MSSVSLCSGLLFGGFVSLANGVQTCPGEARFPPSHACDQPGRFKVCAQLLAYPGGSTLKPWGSKGYFAWMKQPDPSAAVSMMRSQRGDSACIGVDQFAIVAQQAGCANVHLHCEASDISAMLSHYSAKGLDAVAACVRQRCPAGSQPVAATPYPTMAPGSYVAASPLPTRPPLITQPAAVAAATIPPISKQAAAAAAGSGDAAYGLPSMKPVIDIPLPSHSAIPGGINMAKVAGANFPKNGADQAPATLAKMASNLPPAPSWASASRPTPALAHAGQPVTQSPAVPKPAQPSTALPKMVLPNGASISGSMPSTQNLGKVSSAQAAAEGGQSLSPLAGGSVSTGGAPPPGLSIGSTASAPNLQGASFKAAAPATPAPGSDQQSSSSSSGTAILGGIGNIICLVLVCGVCALGAFLFLQKNPDYKHKLGAVHPKIKEHLDKLPSGRVGYENRMHQPGAYGGHGQDPYAGQQQGLYGGRQQDPYAGRGQDLYGGRQNEGSFAGQQQDRYGGQQLDGHPGYQYQEVEQRGSGGGGWGARSQQPGGSFHGVPGSRDGFGDAVANAFSGGGYGPPPPQDSWNHAASNSPNRGGRNNSPARGEQNAPFRHDAYRNPAPPGYE